MKVAWVLFLALFTAQLVAAGNQDSPAATERVVYETNFEDATAGRVPPDFLVLDGRFSIQEDEGNKFLELPGAPLDSFGVLFGPAETADVAVEARVFSTARGRRFPTFAVGLNGVGGYRLQVSPAKREIELFKLDDLQMAVPYQWTSGEWTHLRLQVRKTSNGSVIEGKAWSENETEPEEWLISVEDSGTLHPGRASVWGSPFSGEPIRYDNLRVLSLSES